MSEISRLPVWENQATLATAFSAQGFLAPAGSAAPVLSNRQNAAQYVERLLRERCNAVSEHVAKVSSGPRAAKLGDNVTSIDAFTKFAIAADQTFTACRNELDSRLVHSYPKNCCELISVHLGLALETVNPGSNVEVVRAYNHNANKWHYWVEMDGVVFDLTAHQFDEYRQPLVCAKPSPFESRFPDIERISSSDAERAGPFTVNPKFMCIFSDCYQLASSTSLRE